MRVATIVLAVLFLSGCASQIMKGFEGKSMVDVVAQYGMPASSYELGGGERAFVWEMSNSVVVPGNMNTTSTLVGNTVFSSSYVAPGYVASSRCSYALKARQTRTDIEGPAAWTITGYFPPRASCE
jgi:hypothetical protein